MKKERLMTIHGKKSIEKVENIETKKFITKNL